MALRSLLRKGPALAGGLTSPVSLRPRPPIIQALQQAAGSRFLSHGPSVSGPQAVYSEELLREKSDRAHAEFERNMKVIQQQMDEQWRLEVEFWAKLRGELHTIEKTCNVLMFLCASTAILSLTNAM
ncbi:uncharacterized protein LOC124673293 [Lolium rigidum]|uniref:uncharacterized protein LOC124673293 n=1 Tax=Lolium rigidum TaxID=89674 RepID=UPI001F5D75B3|nr:uncharacterized protein LOC124673293 [Lolium rigidum]